MLSMATLVDIAFSCQGSLQQLIFGPSLQVLKHMTCQQGIPPQVQEGVKSCLQQARTTYASTACTTAGSPDMRFYQQLANVL